MREGLNQNGEAYKPKSFDVLASVHILSDNIARQGQVSPESWQRVYDEELSFIAEGINRPLTTEFHLQEHNGSLSFFDKGKWQPYIGTLFKGLDTAKHEAQQDPRKTFLAERAANDLLIGYKLEQLKPGEKLSWYSPFPSKERTIYGDEFLQDLGFQPQREMGFLYLAEGSPEGGVVLNTQSVDNSDEHAFTAAMSVAQEPNSSIEDMMVAYDSTLEVRDGQAYYAGRKQDSLVPEENSWSVVKNNKELFEEFYFPEIEKLARREGLSRAELERAKQRLTYGVWAALKQRLDNKAVSVSSGQGGGYGLAGEVGAAYQALSARGETLFGCGGAITGESAVLSASANAVHDAIFGNKKWMSCPYCGARQYGDPCASVLACGKCEARVENGVVKSYGKAFKASRGFLDILFDEIQKWNQEFEQKQATDEIAKKRAEKEKAVKAAQTTLAA